MPGWKIRGAEDRETQIVESQISQKPIKFQSFRLLLAHLSGPSTTIRGFKTCRRPKESVCWDEIAATTDPSRRLARDLHQLVRSCHL